MKNTHTYILILAAALLSLTGGFAQAQVKPEHAGSYDFVYGATQGSCNGKFGLGVLTVTKTGQVSGSYRCQADGSTGTVSGTIDAKGNAVLKAGNSQIKAKLRGRTVVLVDGDYETGKERGFVAGVRK